MENEVDKVVKKLRAQKKEIENAKAAKVAVEPVNEVRLDFSKTDEISALKKQFERDRETIKQLKTELKRKEAKVVKLEKQLLAITRELKRKVKLQSRLKQPNPTLKEPTKDSIDKENTQKCSTK
jgi:predicted RNase H-like nuclease (RuvC/YqgF family)